MHTSPPQQNILEGKFPELDFLFNRLTLPENSEITSIKRVEAEFIYRFIRQQGITRTLEVGFAFGYSCAYIMAATKKDHFAIDPFQDRFHNLGLENIEAIGLSQFLRFENDYSHFVLPRLAKEGVKIDFAFIDGNHKFDNIFCDFYFIDLMLNKNGYVLFHDAWMRSTQHVLSWIKQNKANYSLLKIPLRNCLLVQKNGEDVRRWFHFRPFHTMKSTYSYLSHVSLLDPDKTRTFSYYFFKFMRHIHL